MHPHLQKIPFLVELSFHLSIYLQGYYYENQYIFSKEAFKRAKLAKAVETFYSESPVFEQSVSSIKWVNNKLNDEFTELLLKN